MRAALVRAQAQHVAPIAARARAADIAELWAQARATPAACMARGLADSTEVYTALLDGVPVVMFGVTEAGPGEAAPWMVGTTDLDSLAAQKELLRISREVVGKFRTRYHLLYNEVDARNAAAIRWLAWLGFTLGDPQPTGCDGEMFIPFWSTQPCSSP